jgi:uncharacterized protein (DUF2141 family)
MRSQFSLLFLCFSLFLHAQDFELTISFEGLSSNKGKVLFKIIDDSKNEVGQGILAISNKKASKSISLPSGKYAVSCFHDADDNRELTTNFMGIPDEKYGFSNDARGIFGPPDLKDQLFELNENKTIKVQLK